MNDLVFKISAEIKNILGKDLITSDHIAISELVKNAYDAYASKVVLTFEEDKIMIADNGKGMSFSDIQNKWLFLGFSAKKDGSEDTEFSKQESYRDKIKRHYAGAKGIGKMSCDRLGKYLEMSSKSASSDTLEKIFIDWTKFENNQNEEFVNVKVTHESEKRNILFPENSQTGTILEITSIDDNAKWTRNRLLELKQSLEKLINPFSETNEFEIEIVCKAQEKQDNDEKALGKYNKDIVNGIVKNSIIEILSLKTTQIDVSLDRNEILTTITDRGEIIYKIKEINDDFAKLNDAKINLYYLNQTAKMNFSKRMGLQPLQYGSIFLFRNGFRIMPFGSTGDDSWNLDYRSQQGNRRFLGTRDLFGRVDIITKNVDDLKEVSSRDGGLIKTEVSQQLFEFFKIAHRRLERYVSGVLWGEAFLRKEYFKNEIEALNQRKNLLERDKENDNPNYILQSSIGSKIDFVQLVKTLTKDKDVEVLFYNKDLANIVSDPLQSKEVKPQFIADLEKIAADTNDDVLLFNIDEAKRRIAELQKAKDAAELKANEQEIRRIEAEEKARLAEIERLRAEVKRKEEEDAKKIAQFQAIEAELKRREEELKRKEAEQKQKEEAEKRRIAEAEKAAAIQERDIQKADITLLKEYSKIDIPAYIKEYLPNYNVSIKEILFNESFKERIIRKTQLLDLSVILDNLVSNSKKANAEKIFVDFKKINDQFCVDFSDNGDGVDIGKFNKESIFEAGITNRRGGSGIGLSTIREAMKKELNGDIEFLGNGLHFSKGATFRLKFR